MWRECFEIINTVKPIIWVSIYNGLPEKMSQTHNLLILELKQTKRKRRMEPKTVPQMQPV